MDKKEILAEEIPQAPAETGTPPLPEEKSAPAGERSEAEEEKNAMREFIRRDAAEFRRQYPQVDLGELDADPLFRLFCGSRYGREPLADLYGDYLALTESAQRRESRARRATGSGGSGGYEALTAAEQRELSEWNKAYPHMKMSARDFLSRE